MNVLVNGELGQEKRTNLQKHASQIQADAAGQSPGTPALHNTADCGSGIWERYAGKISRGDKCRLPECFTLPDLHFKRRWEASTPPNIPTNVLFLF